MARKSRLGDIQSVYLTIFASIWESMLNFSIFGESKLDVKIMGIDDECSCLKGDSN